MFIRTSPVVQWLRLHARTTEGKSSVPCHGAKIWHGAWHGQKKCLLENIWLMYKINKGGREEQRRHEIYGKMKWEKQTQHNQH